MEIDFLARNKRRRALVLYTMVIQSFVIIIGLSLLGYYIGTKVSDVKELPLLLAGIGVLIGVIVGFITLYKTVKGEERYEKNV